MRKKFRNSNIIFSGFDLSGYYPDTVNANNLQDSALVMCRVKNLISKHADIKCIV